MNMDRPIRILFVEDVPYDVDLAVRAIRKEGLSFEFERVDTEADFLEALEAYSPDLVVSDYAMPGFSGMRALELFLARDPKMPFIILTGSINEETAAACIKAGATDYVLKERIVRLPFAINDALAQREVTRQRDAATEALRTSEARLASIFRVAPVGIGVVIDRVILEVNDVLCRMLGYSRKELVGEDSGLLYLSREEYDFVGTEKYQQIAETGSGTVETRWRRKDGRTIEILLSSTALDAPDLPRAFTFTALDITERKRAEGEARKTAHFLQNLIDALPNPIFFRDTEGVYMGCNRAFETHTGLARDQIIGRSLFDIMPRDRAERYHRSDLALVARGSGTEVYEEEVILGDGKTRNMIVNKATFTNVDGSLGGVVGALMDITERKLTAQDLRFRNLVLTTQQEVSPDGILVVDENGMIVTCNRRFQDMWAIPAGLIEKGVDESVLRYVASLTTDPSRFLGGAEILRQDRRETRRGELTLADGRIFEWYSTPMFGDDGHYYGRVWYHRDLTDRRKAEEERTALREQLLQSQKMELVGKLAGGVAHDFNNILMVQKGYCELIGSMLPPGSPPADSLAQIEACTDRAASLTRQLLAFSRKQTLQPRVLDFNLLAEGLVEMLRRVVGEDLDVVIELASEPAMVEADSGQIEQVLVNLAANARDAMPEGGKLTMSISTGHTEELFCREHPSIAPGRYVMLVVSDTGSGMDAETKERIFEPFFTTKGKGRGTGLGLSMVQGIIIQSGGDIWVSSEPGKGATFTICLPYASGNAVEPAPIGPRPAQGRGELILVVEDEPALRKLVTSMIQGLGYQTSEAASGETAIALVEREGLRPDLILTDVIMPGVSGRVLAESLRAILPGAKVVYMSGYTDDAIARHGVLDPDVEFIQKPFSMADLADKIRTVLSS